MKNVLELWELACAEDIEGLKKCIYWEGNNSVFYNNDPEYPYRKMPKRLKSPPPGKIYYNASIASKVINPERLKRMRPGDLVVPAKYRVQEEINEHLEKAVSPRILWDTNRRTPELKLFHVPHGLKGALWLQFAHAIHGNKNFYYCDQCSAAFELDPRSGAKKGRKFCSNACRSKALRNRQVEARRLFQEGMEPAEIAKSLNSEIKTVKKWISAGKKKGAKS